MTYFYDALPIAGVDGTLETRMRNSSAHGLLRAKTGTLDVATNLAGFIPQKDEAGNYSTLFPFVMFATTEKPTQDLRASRMSRILLARRWSVK